MHWYHHALFVTLATRLAHSLPLSPARRWARVGQCTLSPVDSLRVTSGPQTGSTRARKRVVGQAIMKKLMTNEVTNEETRRVTELAVV